MSPSAHGSPPSFFFACAVTVRALLLSSSRKQAPADFKNKEAKRKPTQKKRFCAGDWDLFIKIYQMEKQKHSKRVWNHTKQNSITNSFLALRANPLCFALPLPHISPKVSILSLSISVQIPKKMISFICKQATSKSVRPETERLSIGGAFRKWRAPAGRRTIRTRRGRYRGEWRECPRGFWTCRLRTRRWMCPRALPQLLPFFVSPMRLRRKTLGLPTSVCDFVVLFCNSLLLKHIAWCC